MSKGSEVLIYIFVFSTLPQRAHICRIIQNLLQHALVNYSLFSHSILFLVVFDSILVSTGRPTNSSRKTEIINLDQEGVTCKDLEEYPWKIYGALGFNMGSLPVICGGRDESGPIVNQCHRLESGKWQPFANLTQGYLYTILGLL